MKIKFLLLLTDNKATLYNQAYENLLTCEGKFEEIKEQISSFLRNFPKISFHLLIDLKTNFIHEDRLPRLYPWDLARYIFHKKNEGKSKNSFFGFSFLKQEKTSYLRWVHIPQNDPLYPWILWFETFSKSSGKVFFIPLEISGFLKKQQHPLSPYQVLFYSFSPQIQGYVIFEKERLLLARSFYSKDDFQAALHFLSRKFPDIHEKLQIYSVNSKADFLNSQVIKLNDPNCLLQYFFSQKKPSLKIQRRFHLTQTWIRTSILSFIAVLTLMNGALLYQAYDYKNKLPGVQSHTKILKLHIETLKKDLGEQDILSLQKAINAYSFLKSQNTFSSIIFEKLALVLKNKYLKLEGLNIKYGKCLEIILDISMKQKAAQELLKDFDHLLLSCKTTFPQGQVDVLEAPLNSGSHETFKSSFTSPLPLAKIRILLP
ncbi:MAG: hypothetical protein K2Y08_05155 [Alphaproteobacteria bacterium]|nr:hypothetical protein [Alphaproteobacteria bacterium]